MRGGSFGSMDLRPLAGFDFRCQPSCGLCCYTTPRVTPEERERLLSIRPELRAPTEDPGHLPSYPDGGACRMLLGSRCGVHELRPGPCAEFPISVHLGERPQCTLVLSCPGVDLAGLDRQAPSGAPGTVGPGLAGEHVAAERSLAAVAPARRAQSARRWTARARQSGLEDARIRPDEVDRLRLPTLEELQDDPLPERSEGLEVLPLFLDEGRGPVAMSRTGEFLEMFAVRERGGIDGAVTQLLLLDGPPATTEGAERRLRAYLRYVVQRDAFEGAALAAWRPNRAESIGEILRSDLREVSAAVVARATYRARLAGRDGRTLDTEDIDRGIRATDADYLDRPTLGEWV